MSYSSSGYTVYNRLVPQNMWAILAASASGILKLFSWCDHCGHYPGDRNWKDGTSSVEKCKTCLIGPPTNFRYRRDFHSEVTEAMKCLSVR